MNRKQNYQFPELMMGVCYYPEHWDESLWESDIDRMLDAGIRAVRIAEFSWVLLEPEEGVFDFSLFDRFLDLCLAKGMKAILGTPTATPPAWLTRKYPEVLNRRIDKVRYEHGGRRHYNYNSPVCLEKCAVITEKMAQHYGPHPAVIGWQIDNELNCETEEFYSDADAAAFRSFLKEKYRGSLEELNRSWGTVFWSQRYSDWEEIPLPGMVLNNGWNPHQRLDYFRFISESAIRFAKLQAQIIRKYRKSGDFITTNGMFAALDNHRLQDECLDIYVYDSYPNFAYALDRTQARFGEDWKEGDLNDRKWSLYLTQVRSICPHFGIMEQQSGSGSWVTRMAGPAPKPGQLKLWAMQSLSHGADFVSFFRWRTAAFGTEMYWHGILNYDNRDNRRLKEVKEFHAAMEKLKDFAGADCRTAFGLLQDYDNQFDALTDQWNDQLNSFSLKEIFAASQLTHRPFDIVNLTDVTEPAELMKYPVLFYPHPMIISPKRARLLEQYVKEGGCLVIGARAGYKDLSGKCVMQPMPGELAPLTGTTVEDFTFTGPADEPQTIAWDDASYAAPLFCDILHAEDTADAPAKVLARFEKGYFAGEAALTEHAFGKGRCLHLGSTFGRGLVRKLLSYLGCSMPFDAWGDFPEEVETVLREKDGREVLILLNYRPEPIKVRWKMPVRSLLGGGELAGDEILPAYGVEAAEVLK